MQIPQATSWAALAAGILLMGCYPQTPTYIDEYDLLVTNYSPTYDFQSRSTYAIPDSVVRIDVNSDPQDPEFIGAQYGDRIINAIKRNMSVYGWTLVDETEDPDMIILPSAGSTLNLQYSWGYWGWYYPGYYPGWGWGYPGYPGYGTTVSSYRTGSVLFQMTAPKDIGPDENMPVVWLGAFNGLLEGSTNSVLGRIDSQIDQAFRQSPYLQQL